jgi:hypothetical protein
MTAHLSTRLRPAIRNVIAIAVFTMAASLVAGTSSANAAGGHYVSHGYLHCDPNRDQVGVGKGMTASVRPGEWVQITHSIYVWTSSGWQLNRTEPPVRSYPTSSEYVSTMYSQWHVNWYFLNGYYAPTQGMPLWNRGNGYHYKVLEDIKWFSSNGAISDQHAATLNGLNGGTYCSL